uniref:Uncharacterized protein n=1 Tax=Equus asinus TaxID=9793 RepID=A0A9L0IKL6_EQUAS
MRKLKDFLPLKLAHNFRDKWVLELVDHQRSLLMPGSSACSAQQQSTFFLAFNMASSKKVTLSVLSREQSEGVGARVRRSIGRPELKNLDPFLLFDEFKGGRPGGFPDHPHRGFETKTQTNRKVERRYQNAPALPPSGDDHCSRFGVCLSRHLHAYPNMTAYNFI